MIAGLTPKLLRAWAGTDRLSELPLHHARLARLPVTAASRALAHYVAGVDALEPPETLRGLAVLPLGESYLVCDRLDAPQTPELVCWPDDSSYHLASCIPAGKREAWLDIGTGSGFAPLLRRGISKRVAGIDANPRAIAMAALGAELSGAEIELATADIVRGDLWPKSEVRSPKSLFDLVTCNAPIPDHTGPMWRATTPAFFTALWAACEGVASELVIVHGAMAALATVPDVGERVTVSYSPGFGVLWWRPHDARRTETRHRELTRDRPHLDATDQRSAL